MQSEHDDPQGFGDDSPIVLPNGWRPRWYQQALWDYLANGGRRAAAVWHRRAGKDDLCLHWTACAMYQRVGNYWHMLPEAAQARKAIWNAVNPHTGKKRIDEAFPIELRKRYSDHEMFIEMDNGSTWQVVGSDNFDSLVGSAPCGVIFSEWSIANPNAWAILSPILLENNGWALFIYTPRGKNHGHETFELAQRSEQWFGEMLTVDETGLFTEEQLQNQLEEYQALYGEEAGRALFEQEFRCSFDAAILGAVYGKWMAALEAKNRVRLFEPEPGVPINTAWDLGYDDATSIWWWQVVSGTELRILDYYESSGQDIPHYCDILASKGYNYTPEGKHFVPHDARNKLLAAGGRSIVERAWFECGVRMTSVDATSQQNGIEAARKTLEYAWFNNGLRPDPITGKMKDATKQGREFLKQYRFEMDDKTRILKPTPLHDYTSHAADAFEIIGQVWKPPAIKPKDRKPKFWEQQTMGELMALNVPPRDKESAV